MSVSTKNFAQMVSDQAAAIQGRSSALVDLTEGSVLLAIIEANAAQGLWMESQALSVLAVTRAATSTGADLDSFVGDYGMTRLPAAAAAGNVTFSRFTNTSSALVPVGTQVQTADGTETFAVTADPTNPAWSAPSNGYVINAGVSSVTVPVTAVTGGSGGNVIAGAISLILNAIPHVDTVTNALAFSGGADVESDAALRVRFQNYLASLSSGTPTAIATAIADVQTGLSYAVFENVNPDGSAHPGYLTIVVDDGSGHPPSSLLTAVANAVNAVRAAGITFGVFAPTLTTVAVAVTVVVGSGYSHTSIAAAVTTAIQSYINSLTIGQTLYWTRLFQVIYDAAPGITDVTGLTLNGGTSDIVAPLGAVSRAGAITVS